MKKPRITLKQLAVLSPVLLAAGVALVLLAAWLKLAWLVGLGIAVLAANLLLVCLFGRCPLCGGFVGVPAPVHVLPALFALDRGFVLTAPQYLLCPRMLQLCTGRPIRLICPQPG